MKRIIGKTPTAFFGALVMLLACALLFAACGQGGATPASSAPAVSAPASVPPASVAPASSAPAPAAPSGGVVSLSQAVEIATGDAAVDVADILYSGANQDVERGEPVYEVIIVTHDMVYDYVVRIADGQIVDMEHHVNDNFEASGAAQGDYIGSDAAVQIALEDAGLTQEEVRLTKAKLDEDDGRFLYEVEFETLDTEYDYDIDALTGDILKKEMERAD